MIRSVARAAQKIQTLEEFKMSVKRKMQVFISSTYVDMKEERQAVVEAVLRAGHIPAGMELFASGDTSQWETIKRWIEDSDVFMLILGERYGSIEPVSGVSYIQREYEYAEEIGKPLFAAIISDSYSDLKMRNLGRLVTEQQNNLLMSEFKKKVTSKICRFFNDCNELKLIVFESLGNVEREGNVSGWVRGDEVINVKTTIDELSRVQSENSSLRNEMEQLKTLLREYKEDAKDYALLSTMDEELLKYIEESNGEIEIYDSVSGLEIQLKNRVISPREGRELARWRKTIQSIKKFDFIHNTGGVNYVLTDTGYEFIDSLKSKSSE